MKVWLLLLLLLMLMGFFVVYRVAVWLSFYGMKSPTHRSTGRVCLCMLCECRDFLYYNYYFLSTYVEYVRFSIQNFNHDVYLIALNATSQP